MKKSKRIHRIQYILAILLLVVSLNADAALHITVESHAGWGNAPTSNIRELCKNIALHFNEVLHDEHKVDGELTIVYRAQGPIAFYRSYFGGGPDEYKIGLTVTGTYWSQFSYQFGHEFCHIMQNHDVLRSASNKNGWFHEAICELANLWVIRRMGETWENRPPYPNWVSYRHQLLNYANGWMMSRPEVQYAGTGAEWLAQWEEPMRNGNAFDYARVAQLSYKFLSVFEENPEAWNAVRQMPASQEKMSTYMKEWYNAVDTEDKKFVEEIAKEMGISVVPVVAVATTLVADVNGDGYVDLYDVMIVRSGMQNRVSYNTDINGDGRTDEVDLMIVKAKALEAIAAAAPSKRKVKLTTWADVKRR